MFTRVIGIALLAGCLVCATSAPTLVKAQEKPASEQSSPDTGSKPTTATKPTTARQQKMKDCAAKWKQEKAEKHVSGRDAYRAFMKECLKG